MQQYNNVMHCLAINRNIKYFQPENDYHTYSKVLNFKLPPLPPFITLISVVKAINSGYGFAKQSSKI